MLSLEQRVEQIEATIFQPQEDVGNGLPESDSLPQDLEISVTASLEGAYVILSWGNWQPDIKGYEIWIERPDGQNELAKTVQYSPATLTVATDTAAPFIFKIRPVMSQGQEVSIERAPAIAATIPVAVVGSGDIGNGVVQDQHFDRVSANQIVIVDADILSLTANKITAGTINAAVITVTNIDASNINTGTLNASVVNVTNINANNINAGSLNAAVVNVINLNASNINTGTLTSVNIVSGTYSLVSGAQQMTIDGTNGFRQFHSTSNYAVRILSGTIGGYAGGSSLLVWDSLITLFGGSYSGALRTFINGNLRSVVGTDTVSGHGFLHLYDQSGNFDIELNANTASPFYGLNVNGVRVVGPQEADPGASPTTDQLRTILLNHGLIG